MILVAAHPGGAACADDASSTIAAAACVAARIDFVTTAAAFGQTGIYPVLQHFGVCSGEVRSAASGARILHALHRYPTTFFRWIRSRCRDQVIVGGERQFRRTLAVAWQARQLDAGLC